MITLYVTRHGKALSNEKKIACSISEKYCGGLSKIGEKQAEELVPELLKNKYDVILISPLIRSYQTLIPYLKTFMYPPKIIISDMILERDIGDLKGKLVSEVKKYIDNSDDGPVSWTPPNGESLYDVEKRVKEFISYLKNNFEGKSVLICGHSMFLRTLDIFLKKGDMKNFYSTEEPQHGVIKKYNIS